jgi:hypothetical protein
VHLSFEDLRPAISGILGALVFAAIAPLLLRWVPIRVNSRSVATLVDENRPVFRAANALSAIGVISMFVMYLWWDFAESDLRPLGIGLGFAVCSPVVTVHVAALVLGRNLREVVVAYATTQKLPFSYCQC